MKIELTQIDSGYDSDVITYILTENGIRADNIWIRYASIQKYFKSDHVSYGVYMDSLEKDEFVLYNEPFIGKQKKLIVNVSSKMFTEIEYLYMMLKDLFGETTPGVEFIATKFMDKDIYESLTLAIDYSCVDTLFPKEIRILGFNNIMKERVNNR